VAYADPFIGSGGFGYAYGSAFPGAAAPFGLAKVGPDTRGPYDLQRFLHYSGYWYGDDKIQGFSHLHLHGTGLADYGVLTVMPTDAADASRTTAAGYESAFDKGTEVAGPGYYAVTLDRGAIRAEITATEHAAHHRFTFPQAPAQGHLVFDLDHHLDSGEITSAQATLIPAERRITGQLHSVGGMSGGFGGYDVYFELRTRTAWATELVWAGGAAPAPGTQVSGQKVGFALSFDHAGAPVELQVGVSMVSPEGATNNLSAELPGWSFEDTRKATEEAWSALLGTVRIWGGTEAERRIFYSALYRAFLMPSVQSDTDGRYRFGPVDVIRDAQGFRFCSDLSLWDTYRTLNPLYVLVAPDRARDVAASLHAMAKETGFFPKWPLATGEAGSMLGASAEIVLADTYVKGVTDWDAAGAYPILRAAALDPVDPAGGRGGRGNVVPYMQYGYVPAGVGPSVSLTLEYSHDDFALAALAGALGETADQALLQDRSSSYRQLFDPGTGFLRAKNTDGTFADAGKVFDPHGFTEAYAEANAWQSLWAQHDIPGLVDLLGGEQAFSDKLTELFEDARLDLADRPLDDGLANAAPRFPYWHGNEPDIHAAYAFAQAGRPDLTQRWVRWVLNSYYADSPEGLAGNDDGGTLSAWAVVSAMGFYPIAGSDRYILGAPLFPRVEIAREGGVFVIEAPGASAKNLYVQSVELNGEPLYRPEIRHADLRAGGTLRFELGPSPTGWGR
jgi:predicted alpha-1,2-mannosidase